MKKILSILMVIACLGIAIPAQAQLKFGLKGGLNITSLSFSGDMFKGDNRTGFFIGPMAEFTIPVVGLGLDVAALYNQAKGKANYYGEDIISQNETLKSFEVPVNLKWTFGMGSTLGAYIAAGPQFQHLQVGLNYNFSINKMAKAHIDDYEGSVNMKKNTWQVSLAYLF